MNRVAIAACAALFISSCAVAPAAVSPRYVAEMRAAGYTTASAQQLIALRDHGVSAAFVARLKAHGYNNLSVPDLIRLRDARI